MSNEELAVLAQQGNREAISALWEQVKRLLYQLARRFYKRYGVDCCTRRGVTMADLEQECFLALLDAVRGFKPTRGYRFTTYLTRASESRFKAAMGLRKVNPLDIADSMNAPALEDGESPVETGDLIPDPQAAGELENIDTTAEAEYLHKVLGDGLDRLPLTQSTILRRRFYGRQTRQQAAAALHIPPADIRREESKALQALRRDCRVMALEYLAGAAYEGTGWNAWYYRRGSVEERLVERG
ncbi:sigma-70 family RNA polymerase sigma factor [Acutalibacter sp. 1XD8-36]|uniref:sigma-70 family RNA polymerase sigma factor n=1 Tax=Acutalibacter sp. 1XD8-36 TaxID=2320852 RepID=UPI00260B8ED1|nr:sigma-70 family RNA polymerase sigma factor [Acutalibacter sp. 1XD8-36]